MEIKATVKSTNEVVTGTWHCFFDEWTLLTSNGEQYTFDKLTNLNVLPWLPADHFCQPYLLEKLPHD